MAFVAKKLDSEEIIVPMQAEDSEEYLCVQCDSKMFPRPHRDSNSTVTRHFYHYRDNGCAGESDVHEHAKMKAVSLLMQIFQDNENVKNIDWEMQFRVGPSKSQFADAGLVFRKKSELWGDGIAIEVQHRNSTKDRYAITKNYNDLCLTVLWLRPHTLLQEGDRANEVLESLLTGEHDSLKRNGGAAYPDPYPYVVFHSETVSKKEKPKEVKSKTQLVNEHKKREYYKSYTSYSKVYKTKYKSLTPERKEWHCDKNGCLEHFNRVFRYERDGVKIEFKRCVGHGEPSEPEIKAEFGKVRYDL
jgi:hypothetical protein